MATDNPDAGNHLVQDEDDTLSFLVSPHDTNAQLERPQSLVNRLLAASNIEEVALALKEDWTPDASKNGVGEFKTFSQVEALIHTVPLFQRAMACLTSKTIDIESSSACADFISMLCLVGETSLLITPTDVMRTFKRVIQSKRKETKESVLKCILCLIKADKDYRQSFVDCDLLVSILDEIDYENGDEVASYACKSVLSLVDFITDKQKMDSLLSRALPALVKMLTEGSDLDTKLNALNCLEGIRNNEVVVRKLQENEVVSMMAPLLKTNHPEIRRLAVDLFGKNVTDENSGDLKTLPPDVALQMLKEIYAKGTGELQSVRLSLLESLLSAVHRNEFMVDSAEARFLSEVILKDTKACASKAIDILVVAWDMHENMAGDLSKSSAFLAKLPQTMSVSQAALNIIHSMIQADIEASHAMAENLSVVDLKSLRKEMKEGSNEVKMIVLDIFVKLIDQEERCDELIQVGFLEDIVNLFDTESLVIRRRIWRICANLFQKKPTTVCQTCVQLGLVQKFKILFTDFLDQYREEASAQPMQMDSGLQDLFEVLKSVSETKPGAKAMCNSGVLSHLLEFITPTGIICEEVRELVVNVLSSLPVKASRLLAQNQMFDVLSALIRSPNAELKRLGFDILKLMSFKDCSTQLTETQLVMQMCMFLHGSNQRLKRDAVTVICKMAKSSLNTVCNRLIESRSASALWNASRSGPENEEERKILWKAFQKVKSIEAKKKAEQKKGLSRSTSRAPSRASTIGSHSSSWSRSKFSGSLLGPSRSDTIYEDSPKHSRRISSEKFSRRLGKARSNLSGYFKRNRSTRHSIDSDQALLKGEESVEIPSSRFQKFKSFPSFRKGK